MKLTVASSPHIRGNFRTNRIMLDVVLALLPA
jgi:Na+-translocating ferredoxin:NAD+ oxidoreductase RnfD subunit